jgi:HK97 gp10 family phage protein
MSGGARMQCRIEGLEALFGQLAQVRKPSTRTAILRRGITKGTRLVRKTARQMAPVYKGKYLVPRLLRRSMDFKVQTYPSGAVVGVIGPAKGHKTQAGVRTRGKRKGQPYYQDPTKYAHLVEKGTKRSRSFQFMQRAWEQTQAQVRAILEEEIGLGVEKALAKEVGKKR